MKMINFLAEFQKFTLPLIYVSMFLLQIPPAYVGQVCRSGLHDRLHPLRLAQSQQATDEMAHSGLSYT